MIASLRDYLRRARKEGKTILMASHMLEEVRETCNQVALLNAGHLIKFGDISMLERLFAKTILVEVLKPPTPSQVKMVEKAPGVESISIRGKKMSIRMKCGEMKRA
ncbi:MAG: hypothetical protein ACK4GQ_06550 [Candidatus Hadarchaeales archaeon]